MHWQDVLEAIEATDDGWEGTDSIITCPCGHNLEPDAEECADGCVNPIREQGWI